MVDKPDLDFDALEKVDDTTFDDSGDAEWFNFDDRGDTVLGEVRKIVENAGEYDTRVYELSTGVGEAVVFWGSAAIDRQVDRADIGVGDVIGVRYLGKDTTKDGNEVKQFDVRRA